MIALSQHQMKTYGCIDPIKKIGAKKNKEIVLSFLKATSTSQTEFKVSRGSFNRFDNLLSTVLCICT